MLIAEFEPERWPRAAARWRVRSFSRRRGRIEESALALHAVQTLKGPSRVLGVPTDEHLLAAFDAYDKKVTEPARKALQPPSRS